MTDLRPLRHWTAKLGKGVLACLVLALAACGHEEGEHAAPFPRGAEAPPPGVVGDMAFEVGPPPFKEPDIFPCTECHDDPDDVDAERRELTMAHEDIELKHDPQNRWCLDCHDARNRDMLRLANGTLIPFTESYRLCGQCHGDKYRDWRAGVHGRRVGRWDGEKEYLLCVYCHDSHDPRFRAIEPMPTPIRPEALR